MDVPLFPLFPNWPLSYMPAKNLNGGSILIDQRGRDPQNRTIPASVEGTMGSALHNLNFFSNMTPMINRHPNIAPVKMESKKSNLLCCCIDVRLK